MVKQIYDGLCDKVRSLNMFQKVVPRAELVRNDKGVWPGEFTGGDKFKILNPGDYAGLCYLRSNGRISMRDPDNDPIVPCERIQIASIPIVLVAFIKRDQLKCKADYAGDYLFESLLKELSGRDESLIDSLDIKDVNVIVSGAETDLDRVIFSEFGQMEISYSYAAVLLEMNAELTYNKSCMDDLCSEETYV